MQSGFALAGRFPSLAPLWATSPDDSEARASPSAPSAQHAQPPERSA